MKHLFSLMALGTVLFLTACGTTETQKKDPAFKGNGKRIIVDVRTSEEWSGDGHADCAVNYPLDGLDNHASELSEYDTVIFVCRSGGRAGQATDWLSGMNKGNVVMNGGAWSEVPCK